MICQHGSPGEVEETEDGRVTVRTILGEKENAMCKLKIIPMPALDGRKTQHQTIQQP